MALSEADLIDPKDQLGSIRTQKNKIAAVSSKEKENPDKTKKGRKRFHTKRKSFFHLF